MIGGELGMKVQRIRLRGYQGTHDIIFEEKDGSFFISGFERAGTRKEKLNGSMYISRQIKIRNIQI